MLSTACEQFLGKSEEEIHNIALVTLEGHQRAIMGSMTVEVNCMLYEKSKGKDCKYKSFYSISTYSMIIYIILFCFTCFHYEKYKLREYN